MAITIVQSADVHHFMVGGEQAPYSPAVAIDSPRRFIFVSGQVAVAPDGTTVGRDDIGAQTTQALTNIASLLHSAGASWDDLVKTTVFIADASLFPGYLAARQAFRPGRFPSSTTVVAPPVNLEHLIEIEAVAAVSG